MDKAKLKKALKPALLGVILGAATYFSVEVGPELLETIGGLLDSLLGTGVPVEEVVAPE